MSGSYDGSKDSFENDVAIGTCNLSIGSWRHCPCFWIPPNWVTKTLQLGPEDTALVSGSLPIGLQKPSNQFVIAPEWVSHSTKAYTIAGIRWTRLLYKCEDSLQTVWTDRGHTQLFPEHSWLIIADHGLRNS